MWWSTPAASDHPLATASPGLVDVGRQADAHEEPGECLREVLPVGRAEAQPRLASCRKPRLEERPRQAEDLVEVHDSQGSGINLPQSPVQERRVARGERPRSAAPRCGMALPGPSAGSETSPRPLSEWAGRAVPCWPSCPAPGQVPLEPYVPSGCTSQNAPSRVRKLSPLVTSPSSLARATSHVKPPHKSRVRGVGSEAA